MKPLIILILLFSLSGCATPTAPPAVPVTSTAAPSPMPDLTNRDEFMARVVAPHYIGTQPSLIFSSALVSERQLFMGVSIRDKDIKNCWWYEDDRIRPCAEGEASRALQYQPDTGKLFPAAYFAVVYETAGEVLILLDYIAPVPLYPTDPVPEYRSLHEYRMPWRVVLIFKDGEWEIKSVRRGF
jgi:hypothetical protein